MLEFLKHHWRDGIEILVLAIGIYQVYRAFRATRGARIMVGFAVILIALVLLSQVFKFQVIGWIITRAAALLAIAGVIIFQPELRNALAKIGSSRWFLFSKKRKLAFLESFTEAVIKLSKTRVGALFAIEREISLKPHLDTGARLDAEFSPELAQTIFHPKTPLHDGGMIIAQDRVAAAGCVFPVSQRELGDRSIGLRHRAAIGISEETDCVAVVVSEETGGISICVDGELLRNLDEEEFCDKLGEIFLPEENADETRAEEKLDGKDRGAAARDRDLVSHKGSP
jgi:diadenylate cyclase